MSGITAQVFYRPSFLTVPERPFTAQTVVGIGDSITAHEMRATDPTSRSANAWLWWAMMFSEGRIIDGGVSAHGGYTASEVRDNSLAEVLARDPAPDYCTVLAGINDVLYFLDVDSGYDYSTESKSALFDIYDSLVAAGITPIACTIPSGMYYDDGGGSPNTWNWWGPVLDDINGWIRDEAATREIPCADFQSVIGDPANPGVAYSGYVDYDSLGCHPSPIGAVVMGQHLLDTLEPLLAPHSIALWNGNTNLITDGLMGGTGLPSGWANTTPGTGITHSRVVDPDIEGQWWRIVKNANNDTQLDQALSGMPTGVQVRLSGRIKINSMAERLGGADTYFRMQLADDTNATIYDLSPANLDVIFDPGGGEQAYPSSNFYWWWAINDAVDSDAGEIPGTALTDIEGVFQVEGSLTRAAGHLTIIIKGDLDIQLAELQLQAVGVTPPIPPPTYEEEVLADSPVLYWRLGEPSGTNANDVSGNNLDGTYHASPTLGVTGALAGDADTAATFAAASSQYIEEATDSALLHLGAFTLECWVKIAGNPAADQFLMGRHRNIQWYIHSNGKQSINFVFGNAPDSTSAIPTGQWNHIAVTCDGTNTAFYLNGVADGTGTTGIAVDTGASNLAVARNNDTSDLYLDASLDEVAVYDNALSGARIAAHYNAGI